MKALKIKITGGGTKSEILKALKKVSDSIKAIKEEKLSEGVELEDFTLMTEINEEL